MALSDRQIDSGPGGQMSFLEHLDELRKRVISSAIFIVLAFFVCYYFSDVIYNFLSVPIRRALSEASRRDLRDPGMTGQEQVRPLSELKEGDSGRFIFDRPTNLGPTVIGAGSSVMAQVSTDANGKLGLFSTERLITVNAIVPAGTRLPIVFESVAISAPNADERLIVTTAQEQFTTFMTVALYAAIALSVPFLLWQIWQFISPALYEHEKAYVTPFIGLSSISFIVGVAFGYYILFPPAAKYLLNLGGGEFQLFLRASDYLDLITILLLAMGLIFQMPAITYVLARIGIINAGWMIRSWKISFIVILIVAAVVSPTNDIPNMLLFAAPMIVLYIVSIFVAWFFGKKRQSDSEVAV